MAKTSFSARLKAAKAEGAKRGRAMARRTKAQLEQVLGRKTTEQIETVAGGLVAGAAHGAGLSFEVKDTEVPIGLVVGAIAAGGAAVMKDDKATEPGLADDVGAIGLGMLTYGAGRFVEDVVTNALD